MTPGIMYKVINPLTGHVSHFNGRRCVTQSSGLENFYNWADGGRV